MKKLLCFFIIFSLVATIYVRVVDPLLYAKFIEEYVETAGVVDKDIDNNDNVLDTDNDSSGDKKPGSDQPSSGGSTGGGTTGGDKNPVVNPNTPSDDDDIDYVAPDTEEENTESGDNDSTQKIEYVYYTQDKSVTGLTEACLLTSFAMLITNAGRIVGTPKEYGPVDVYLANNPDATSKNDRRIASWYYVIANGFNHKWINVDNAKTMTAAQREAKVKELLKTHPWGVIIGGVYGESGTHYIAVRSDGNGGLLFDDPVKSRGPNLTSISQVYGINDWSKIRQIMTIEPNLDSNGKWKDGVYDKCKKNPSNCHVCATNVDC